MRLYKRGRIWWTWGYDESGNRVPRSTRCTDKAAAEAVARRLERELANPDHAAQNAARLTDALASIIQRKQEEAAAGARSPDTAAFYQVKSGHLARLLDVPLRAVTAAAVDGYVSTRRSEGARDTTIHKELVVLRQALQLARRHGLWAGDLDAVMPASMAGDYQPKERWLRPWELRALLAELAPDRAARVAFAVATSANWGETNNARREDLGGQLVRVRGTKTATRLRQVPVVMEWQRELLEFTQAHARGTGGALFLPWQNVRRDLLTACQRATRATARAVEPCSTNDLRRTFGMWGRLSGQPLEYLAPMMGHSTTVMLQRVYGRLGAEQLAQLARECSNIEATPVENVVSVDSVENAPKEKPRTMAGFLVPGDGIEPPTRGFSIPSLKDVSPRHHAEKNGEEAATEALLKQPA